MLEEGPDLRINGDGRLEDHAQTRLALADLAMDSGELGELLARASLRFVSPARGLGDRQLLVLAPDGERALASERIYLALVQERGWSVEHYEAWLTDQLIAGLLPD